MYAVCENIDGCNQPDLSAFIKGDAFDVTMKEGTASTYIWAGCKNNDGSWTKISFGKVTRPVK